MLDHKMNAQMATTEKPLPSNRSIEEEGVLLKRGFGAAIGEHHGRSLAP